ncbi:hypothetical protein EON64_10910 [archaeon]|nr:MAG: hypothetical protein EON64_10910 [archaeon]
MMGRKPTEPRQPANQKGARPGVPSFGGRRLKPGPKQPDDIGAYSPSWPSVPQKGPGRPHIRTKQPPNHTPVPPTAKRKNMLPGRPGRSKPRGYAQMIKMRDRILNTDEEDSQQLSQVQDDVMSAMKIATGLLGGMSVKKKKQQQLQQQQQQHPHLRGGYANPMFEYYRNQAHIMKRGPGQVKIKIAKTPRRPLVPAPPPSMPSSQRDYMSSYQAVKRQGRLATIDPYNAERVVEDALREYNKQNYQIGVVADETIASLTSELMKTMQDCERTVLLLQRLEDEVVPYRNANQGNPVSNLGPAYNPHFANRAATYANELPPVRHSHQELGGLKALLTLNGSNGNSSNPTPNLPIQSMPVFSYINSPSNAGTSSQRFIGNSMSTPNQSSNNLTSNAAALRSNVHINNNLESMDEEKSVLSEAQKSLDQIQKQLVFLK